MTNPEFRSAGLAGPADQPTVPGVPQNKNELPHVPYGQEQPKSMNLLLVDDHALFREGLRALLANISPEVVAFESASVAGAMEECRSSVPTVPVIVLSGEQDPALIRSAIESGAVVVRGSRIRSCRRFR